MLTDLEIGAWLKAYPYEVVELFQSPKSVVLQKLLEDRKVLSGMMKDWILPTFGTLIFWGLWGFIPKITTRFLEPKSAIIYEVLGGILVAAIALFVLNFQPNTHPKGIILAITTGVLGFLGAFCFLNAITRGPVTLVATSSALYPVVSVILANLILQETVTFRQCVGIALALLSMILVAA